MNRVTPLHEQLSEEPVRAHTAIVHDWFQGYHGAERVVEAMRLGLFSADDSPDIFTFHAARELLPEELGNSLSGGRCFSATTGPRGASTPRRRCCSRSQPRLRLQISGMT